ncbi:MAG: hypothetical protein HY043_22065 [Verrucomicrobia bacterium]|nr:hypothetical protein [Verrucomicrobiota bacterium]
MTAQELYHEASRLGLRLEPRGDKLAVIPAKRCPPEFADVLREHKGELLALLDAKAASLTPDCVPWLHIARQILAGEFEGAHRSTLESLIIGLRSIAHPDCRRAIARLQHKPAAGSTP